MTSPWAPIQLAPLDVGIIGLYLAGLLYLGLRHRASPEVRLRRYLLGGRRLTLVPFVATLVTTWYGGILGVGEFTYAYGLVNLLIFGVPYYLFAVLYALFMARCVHRESALTIPERFGVHYGPRSARLGAVLVFALTTPAPYLLMLGVMLSQLLGIPLWLAILLGTVFSTVYLWRGGFQSVVRTDVLQFALMFTGFAVLVGVLIAHQPLEAMWAQLPVGHQHWRGAGMLSWQTILVWFLIGSWTFVDHGIYQRCVAADTGRTAARGILISVGFWFAFDLLTTAAGLYAVVLLPELAADAGGPVAAYPLLAAAVLPPGLLGIFMVALLAVIMSTIDSFTFIGATTLGRDFVPRTGNGLADERQRIRWGIIASAVLGFTLAVSIPSVVSLWYTLGMVLVPGLLLPVLVTFHPRLVLSDGATLTISLAGVLTAGAWLLTPTLGAAWAGDTYPLGLQPMLPGLLVTLALVLVMGRRVSR